MWSSDVVLAKRKRTVTDVLMGNARDAARKAKKKATAGAPEAPTPSHKKPRAQPAAQANEAVKSKRPSSPPPVDVAPGEKRRSPSPTRSETLAAASTNAQLEAKENSQSLPKKSKTLEAKSNEADESHGKKKTYAEGQASQSEGSKGPLPPKTTQAGPKLELELKKKGSVFDPMTAAYWKPGEPVPFLFLAQALDLISDEDGRIISTEILSNVFRTVIATTPEDLLATVYLSANRIAPPHQGIELGIGDASIIRALSEAYGHKEQHVKKCFKKEGGDLGLVAQACRSSQKMIHKPKLLTIARVLATFQTISKESGRDSQDKKRGHIKGLLVAATDCEPQYIIRLLQSKMRIGLGERTVQTALGQAAVYSQKGSSPPKVQLPFEEAAEIIKQVYSVLPIYDKIVPALLEVGVWKLPETCTFSIGVPVAPMLAKATKSVSEIIDKCQGIEYTCEYKYDGERAQIHCMEDGSVEIYSRNAERNTGKYPDVAAAVSRFRKPTVKSFVLDCEIVAYDPEKKILPFQKLSTRPRKAVTGDDSKATVCTFVFDILYINGKPLFQEQLKVRREHLYNSFEEVPGVFQLSTAITSNDLEEIQKFLEAAVKSSCEGLIIKTWNKDATYEPAKRSNNWLKLKKDYMDSIGDSLDLVPIAADVGKGKRIGVYGSFLLACYDERNEEYQTICSIGTGFSEQQLEEFSASLRNKIIPKPKAYYRFDDSSKPDVWFEPSEVWEVKAADLSISPVHQAAIGLVDPNKGISLRFPRFLRVRDDKNPEQATTAEQVADMYCAQKNTMTKMMNDADKILNS